MCIYVGVGQKRSTIAQLVGQLEAAGAMGNCIIVAATAHATRRPTRREGTRFGQFF